ncbi:hypothetical protein ACFQGT_13745 [Natrialbaceae archaeon GCM10025810]|uniref:hypothetical protein n=1 Tax=Halovalidus salilacus TaxID=3075124 RepID=UPI00360EEBBC
MTEYVPQRSGRVDAEREDGPPPLKATLFCPACDHESPADGDWVRRVDGERVELVCPACETTIANRPLRERRRHARGDDAAEPEARDGAEADARGGDERDGERRRTIRGGPGGAGESGVEADAGADGSERERPRAPSPVDAWSHTLHASAKVWRASLRAGASSVSALVNHGR